MIAMRIRTAWLGALVLLCGSSMTTRLWGQTDRPGMPASVPFQIDGVALTAEIGKDVDDPCPALKSKNHKIRATAAPTVRLKTAYWETDIPAAWPIKEKRIDATRIITFGDEQKGIEFSIIDGPADEVRPMMRRMSDDLAKKAKDGKTTFDVVDEPRTIGGKEIKGKAFELGTEPPLRLLGWDGIVDRPWPTLAISWRFLPPNRAAAETAIAEFLASTKFFDFAEANLAPPVDSTWLLEPHLDIAIDGKKTRYTPGGNFEFTCKHNPKKAHTFEAPKRTTNAISDEFVLMRDCSFANPGRLDCTSRVLPNGDTLVVAAKNVGEPTEVSLQILVHPKPFERAVYEKEILEFEHRRWVKIGTDKVAIGQSALWHGPVAIDGKVLRGQLGAKKMTLFIGLRDHQEKSYVVRWLHPQDLSAEDRDAIDTMRKTLRFPGETDFGVEPHD